MFTSKNLEKLMVSTKKTKYQKWKLIFCWLFSKIVNTFVRKFDIMKMHRYGSSTVFSSQNGVVMFYPCLFCPSDNVWRSGRADRPQCAHFSNVITTSWITQQISVEKCGYRSASARWEHQTMFQIVTWTKETWTNHHNIPGADVTAYNVQ